MNAAQSDTFALRPQQGFVVVSSFAIGTMTFVAAGFALLSGSVSTALVFLAVGGLFLFAFDYGSLNADRERVWCTHLFGRGSCRRDELASMSVRAVYRRGGRSVRCAFDRKDGTVAFAVPMMLFGSSQLEQLGGFLGVPFYNLAL